MSDPIEQLAGRRPGLTALAIFAVAFAVFAATTPAGFPNGDAAVYAQQIRDHDFGERTTHLGYYLVGSVASALHPGFDDRALNLLSALFAAATLALLARLVASASGSHAAGVYAAVVLAAHHLFFANAVHAEVYVVELFFLLLAYRLWLGERAVAAGLAFAAATLVTPSALLAAPSFVVLRPQLRPLLRMALAGSLLLAGSLAWVLEDYLFGGRGLLGAAGAAVDPVAAVKKEVFEVAFDFFAFLPLLAAGAAVVASRERCRRYGVALAVLWLFSFFLGERFGDVPVQLPLYGLLAGVAGVGAREVEVRARRAERTAVRARIAVFLASAALLPVALLLAARPFASSVRELPPALPATFTTLLLLAAGLASLPPVARRGAAGVAAVAAACLLLNGVLIGVWISDKNRRIEDYRATVLAVGRAAAPDHLVVGEWSRGILFEHYLSGRSYTDRWLVLGWRDGGWGETKARELEERWREALDEEREIWLLDRHSEMIEEAEEHGYRVVPFRDVYRGRPEGTAEDPESETNGEAR